MYNNQYQVRTNMVTLPRQCRSLVNTVSSTMKRVYLKMTLASS